MARRKTDAQLEAEFQLKLIKELERRFPGCFIFPQDPQVRQGIPDLLILFRNYWAMLEVKASATSDTQPNQPYYVDLFDSMSFAAFIYPENAEDVLNDLQLAFSQRTPTRLALG